MTTSFDALDGVARAVLVPLAQASWRGGLLLALAVLASALLRRRSAATRHALWGAALIGMLALPLLDPVLPGWHIPVLPAAPVASVADVLEATLESSISSVESSASTPAPSRSIPWGNLALAVWAGGVAIALGRIAGSHARLRRLLSRARPVADDRWRSELDAAARAIGLERRVALVASESSTVPLACGLVQPTVVVPPGSDAWPDETRRAVLVHELAHVRRGDVGWRLFARCVRALFWFHPLVRHAVRELELESEKACDDMALVAGERPSGYAGALLSLASAAGGREPAAALALVRRSGFVARIEAVVALGRERRPPGSLARLSIAAVATIAVVVLAATRPVPATAIAPDDPHAVLDANADEDSDDADWIDVRIANAPQGPVAIHSARARWVDLGDGTTRVESPRLMVTNWSSGRIARLRVTFEVPGTTRDQMWVHAPLDPRATGLVQLSDREWSVVASTRAAERLAISITGVRYGDGRAWTSGDDALAPAAEPSEPSAPTPTARPRRQAMAETPAPPASPRPRESAEAPTLLEPQDDEPGAMLPGPQAPPEPSPGAHVPVPAVPPDAHTPRPGIPAVHAAPAVAPLGRPRDLKVRLVGVEFADGSKWGRTTTTTTTTSSDESVRTTSDE